MSDGRDRGCEQRDKQYLGDGVYVGHDGYQIWLTVENGIEVTDAIALEPLVLDRLLAYVSARRKAGRS